MSAVFHSDDGRTGLVRQKFVENSFVFGGWVQLIDILRIGDMADVAIADNAAVLAENAGASCVA